MERRQFTTLLGLSPLALNFKPARPTVRPSRVPVSQLKLTEGQDTYDALFELYQRDPRAALSLCFQYIGPQGLERYPELVTLLERYPDLDLPGLT